MNKEFDAEHIGKMGVDFVAHKYSYEGATYTMKLWDSAGQERFHSLTESFYKKKDGMILVFDVTD